MPAEPPRRRTKKQPEETASDVPDNARSEGAGTAPEPEEPAAPSQPSGSLSAREQNALLNSLQLQSKKSSPQHRLMAENMLNEYQSATRERKWEILAELKDRGFKSLQWYHESQESTVKRNKEKTGCVEGMLTASKILDERLEYA